MNAQRLFPLLLFLIAAATASAGVIAPGLEAQLLDLDPTEPVKVLVVLDHQADIPALERSLQGAKAARSQRHRMVVESLRSAATVSQSDLLEYLAAELSAGRVVGFVPHWLVNSVVVTAIPAVVRDIAARPDVARVEPDLVASIISPVPSDRPQPAFADTIGVGTPPGITAIGAPRVWTELGIDGSGTIVGIMDSGVDGTHPAFADRWRGNFAPPEECWLDASGIGDTSFPVDRDAGGHGTHVTGILTGLAPGDTIGVAPGARWIAANTIVGGLSILDNSVMASLEFMADPDGDPTTNDDVPDVVQNSWGVSEAFVGYSDCDSRWWDAIDNCEAAGVVMVWAAGNEGPYNRTLRSPADRATTPLNSFSVGGTSSAFPYTIAEWSSRGPSGCPGDYRIKPEVVAPGLSIYGAAVGGGYKLLSGTSMAVPHVAGVVALMRQADPDLDVASIKEILMNTALDAGDPGEDNSYGHGFIDAYAAVISVLNNVGSIQGTITDQTTGNPLAGALVANQDGFNVVLTDENGYFHLTMLAGEANFLVSKFGYFDGGFGVSISSGGLSTHNVGLFLKPTATVSGHIYGPDGQPVAAGTVTPLDIPVAPVTANALGYYELVLPRGIGFIYDLVAGGPDMGHHYRTVELPDDIEIDFNLPERFFEDFETGTFFSYPWQGSGHSSWVIDSQNSYEGNFSARSGVVRNDQSSILSLDYYVSVDSYLQFWSKVSSEYYYDNLVFYLDGTPVAAWSGERDWSKYRRLIPRGHHTFKWVYVRDVAFYEGEDSAWLDFVEFPTTGEELFPAVALDAGSLTATVVQGDTTSVPFTITNVGDWTLDFGIGVGDLLKKGSTGGGDDLRVSPQVNGGGPDLFGYQWRDNDNINGPVYSWVDISSDGVNPGQGDDESMGPIPLGFDFNYYGSTYDEVRICTNGFLSFTSTDAAFENRTIPDAAEPNGILAAYWDDLNVNADGVVYYKSEPENDRFIVQYDRVFRLATGTRVTFQVILYRDGSILFQYADVPESDQCTVGIENPAGDDGLLVLYEKDNYLRNGMAIYFDPPVIIATVSPTTGQLAPGSSTPGRVKFDASGLEQGIHVAVMTVTSTDPVEPELLVPLILTVTGVSGEPVADLPPALIFAGAVPNPFNPNTSLKFSLPAPGKVELVIYDVSGRRVRSLVNGHLAAGSQSVPWNGRDDGNRNVASGTYFARLTAAGLTEVKSVTLVR